MGSSIPILLPGATLPERGTLPRFLRGLTWVDFRTPQGLEDAGAFRRLVAGIRGRPPGRDDKLIAPKRDDTMLLPLLVGECPYRGLEVFEEQHAPFFFGREALTQHVVETLRPTRFLAVLGPSGSGNRLSCAPAFCRNYAKALYPLVTVGVISC